MATTKKTVIETVVGGESTETETSTELTADEVAEDNELQNLMSELGTLEDHRVRARRLEPKPAQTCETYDADQFSIDRVRSDYGPGKYQFSILRPNGTAKTHRIVYIAAKLSASVSAAPQGPNQLDMLKLMIEMNRDKSDSTMKWAAIIVPALTGMVTAYFSRAQTTKKEFDPIDAQTQFMKQMALAKEMFGSNNSGQGVDTLLKAIEVVKDLVPGGSSEEGGVLGMITKSLPMLLPLLTNGAKNAPTPVQVNQPPRPAPVAATPVFIPPEPESQENTNEVTQEEQDILVWLKTKITSFVEQAEHGRDHELYGDVFIAELPEEITYQSVIDLLQDPQWFPKLSMIVPEVTAHQSWFQELRDYLVQTLSDYIEEEKRIEAKKAKREQLTETPVASVTQLVQPALVPVT